MKLTKQQREMVAACLQKKAAWVTAADSGNHHLLKQFVQLGFAKQVTPPAPSDSGLVAYMFTPAGRAALEQKEE